MRWLSFSFNDCVVSWAAAYDGVSCEGAIIQPEALSYCIEYATERMLLDITKLAVRCFKDWGSDIHGISRIANQRAFVTGKVAEVEDLWASACWLSKLPCMARFWTVADCQKWGWSRRRLVLKSRWGNLACNWELKTPVWRNWKLMLQNCRNICWIVHSKCVAIWKYLLLSDETQTLKQPISTDVSCDEKIKQRSINARKDFLRYMDAF